MSSHRAYLPNSTHPHPAGQAMPVVGIPVLIEGHNGTHALSPSDLGPLSTALGVPIFVDSPYAYLENLPADPPHILYPPVVGAPPMPLPSRQ